MFGLLSAFAFVVISFLLHPPSPNDRNPPENDTATFWNYAKFANAMNDARATLHQPLVGLGLYGLVFCQFG